MNTAVSRRAFVGALAAGVPMAGAAIGAQSPPGGAHIHPGGPSRDAVIEQLLRQLAAAHNRAHARGISGEDGRDAAAALRVLSVYSVQSGLDATVKRAVSDAVRRRGRESLLYAPLDLPAMRDELRRLGVTTDAIDMRRVAPPDDATRTRALDGLIRNGITRRFTILAESLDRSAAAIDQRVGPAVVIRRAQYSYGGDCSTISDQISYLEAETGIICGLSLFVPTLASVCGALSITLGIEMLLYNHFC
jgi:hypothetical protein